MSDEQSRLIDELMPGILAEILAKEEREWLDEYVYGNGTGQIRGILGLPSIEVAKLGERRDRP